MYCPGKLRHYNIMRTTRISPAVRIAFALMLMSAMTPANARKTSVAIVVDSSTYALTKGPVRQWRDAVERHDGKRTILMVVSDSVRPETIRESLHELYLRQSLEGAVLIGDIPVPMIRRAHHLATAFKMDPRQRWESSSIPSDRYYDDFGLEFTFLRSDGPLYWYDLSPEGRQRVSCSIYSSRIKPSKTDPEHSFTDLIGEYLVRAAESKGRDKEVLDRAFHFGGHGNSSESFNARIDEDRAMYEQFALDSPSESVSYLNYDEDKYVRPRLLDILADPELDYAHLHTHGAVGEQYLSKEPYTFITSQHLEYAKKTFRGKMRSSRDKDKTAASLMEQYGIPSSWLDGWDDPKVSMRDSLLSAATDISLEDLDGYKPGVRLLILDACFNGAFQHDDYIAARYAFAHGSGTAVVLANSVNIIQDHWKNELAGLLSRGECVGDWVRRNMTLESHMFGDPTFAFACSKGKGDIPDVEGLKIHEGRYSIPKVMDILRTDSRMNVRMEALMYIIRHSPDMDTVAGAIETGLCDPYELVRRMASKYAEVCGAPELLNVIAARYMDPYETSRVRFHLAGALRLYPYDEAKRALDSHKGEHWPSAEDYDTILSRLKGTWEENMEDFATITDNSGSVKSRRFVVSAQRNACNPYAVEPMLALVGDESADPYLRSVAAEALGWYTLSCKRQYIYNRCLEILPSDETVADELHRTVRRLEDNANL